MKSEIHPKYQDIKFTCACGAVYVAGSTLEQDFKTELCSNCHPFFTGKQKLVDASGRVDKFMAKVKKAQASKDKKAEEKAEKPAAKKAIKEKKKAVKKATKKKKK